MRAAVGAYSARTEADAQRYKLDASATYKGYWNRTVAPTFFDCDAATLARFPKGLPAEVYDPALFKTREAVFMFEHFFRAPDSQRKFVEIGAFDGVLGSNSYFFENSLGWSGVLIEGETRNYNMLERNRMGDRVMTLHAGVCAEPRVLHLFGTGQMADSTQFGSETTDSVVYHQDWWSWRVVYICAAFSVGVFMSTKRAHPTSRRARYGSLAVAIALFCLSLLAWANVKPSAVVVHSQSARQRSTCPCLPMRSLLALAKLDRVDFYSIDVEGAELDVITSHDWAAVPVRTVLVEMRPIDENTVGKKKNAWARMALHDRGMCRFDNIVGHNNEVWLNPNWEEQLNRRGVAPPLQAGHG